MKTKSLTIFTILTVLTLLAAVCVGCKDKNGVSYSDYPVAGKSYKYTSEYTPNTFDIISFGKHNNTATYRCERVYGNKNFKQYYTMSGDVICLYNDAKQTDLLDSFFYNNTYLERGERGDGLRYYLMEE